VIATHCFKRISTISTISIQAFVEIVEANFHHFHDFHVSLKGDGNVEIGRPVRGNAGQHPAVRGRA